MKHRRLGTSGLQVSVIGLGTNNFGSRARWPFHIDPEGAAAITDRALDVGINMIDTANVYGDGTSEEYIGRALKGKRHQAILATKASMRVAEGPNREGNSRLHLMTEVEGSLRRLGTDYIDLYQLHMRDPDTAIEEAMRTLDDLVREGKVRYIGCSNFAAWQLCEAVWTSRDLRLTPMSSVQPRYSMLDREVEKELLPFCDAYGIGILPYYPLANGFLSGKYSRGQPPPKGTRLAVNDRGLLTDANFDVLDKLEHFAEDRGHTVLELAFAWLLAKPSVSSVIAGATSPEQIETNSKAGEWDLSDEEMAELDTVLGE